MSWRKNSSRNFQFDRPSTPYNVGPGSYEIDPTPPMTSRRPQSATFRSKEKRKTPFDRKKTGVPPPGKYDPISSETQIKITSSFKSNSERSIYDINDNPSPADHGVIVEWGKKKQRRVQDSYVDKPFSPNVGQDTISGFDILEDGSIRPKKLKKKDSRWIGPGTYNIDDFRTNGHIMKESYRKFDPANKSNNPGPGQYDTCVHQFDKIPTISYKSRVRPSSVSSSRKPANYRDPSDSAPKGGELKHEPWNKTEHNITSSTFKSKTKRELFVIREKTPSPTNYQNTERKRPSASKAAFGQKSPRFLDYDGNGVPGPGAYGTLNSMNAALSANYAPFSGRRAVDPEGIHNEVPGPGSYETDSFFDKKSKRPNSVFASNVPRDFALDDNTPGPGSYSVKPIQKSNSRIKIHAARNANVNSFFTSSSRENPSPVAYNTSRELSSKGKSFPKDPKYGKVEGFQTPGPGSYNVDGSLIKKSYNSDLIGVI